MSRAPEFDGATNDASYAHTIAPPHGAETDRQAIREVHTEIVDLPIRRSHHFATQTIQRQSHLIVRVRSEDGFEGLGEGTTPGGPWWGGESVETMKVIIDSYLASAVMGENALDINRVLGKMDHIVARNEFAKAAVEMACYDLSGRALGVPVCDLLGGPVKDSLPVLWTLAAGDREQEIAEAEEKVESGLHRDFKVKVGSDDLPAEIERLSRIIEVVGEKARVIVDPNGSWDELKGMWALPRLSEIGISLLEQPVPDWDLEGLSRLTGMQSVPIMADECMNTVHDALEVARRRAAHVFSLKILKSGGLTNTRKTAVVAEAAGLPCYGGTSLETSVGTAAGLHLFATLPNVTEGCELFAPLLLTDDIVEKPVQYWDSKAWLPSGPGLGVNLDAEKVAHYRRDD